MVGLKSKVNGQRFEEILEVMANFQKWKLIKIPEGCKNLGYKVVLMKSPFDYILAKNKTVVFFDAKTIEDGNFTYSMINFKQIEELIKLQYEGLIAGYLIFFRKEKKIKFATARDLNLVQKRGYINEFLFSYDSNDGKFDFELFRRFNERV